MPGCGAAGPLRLPDERARSSSRYRLQSIPLPVPASLPPTMIRPHGAAAPCGGTRQAAPSLGASQIGTTGTAPMAPPLLDQTMGLVRQRSGGSISDLRHGQPGPSATRTPRAFADARSSPRKRRRRCAVSDEELHGASGVGHPRCHVLRRRQGRPARHRREGKTAQQSVPPVLLRWPPSAPATAAQSWLLPPRDLPRTQPSPTSSRDDRRQ